MAAPVYATSLTTFWLTGSTTVSAIGGGQGGLSNPETDFFIEGTDSISKQAWTNAIKGFSIDALGANFTVPTDGAVILYAKYDAVGSIATKASGGFQAIIGSSTSAFNHYYIGGSDTLAFNSWYPYVIDPNTATADTTTGSPTTSERTVGVLANLPTTSGPTKGNPIAIDAIRYGRCTLQYTLGDSGSGYATFAGAEAWANASTRRLGLLQLSNGSYQMQGFHSIGTVSTAVDLRDSNKGIFIRPSGNNNVSNNAVSQAFNRIELLNASSNFVLDNVTFQALGTRSRGRFYHTAGTWTHTNCQYVNTGLMSLLSTTTITDSTFRSTGVITAPGSTLNGSRILTSRAGTDLSALVWNVATNPSGKLDGMTFSKGTNAHHAIDFGLSSPTTIGLNNQIYTGFGADASTSAALHFKRTTGTVTVNLSGMSTPTYKTAGATIVFVNAKSFKFTLNPSDTNYEWRIYTVTALGSLVGAVEVAGQEVATADNQTYNYTYTVDQPIAVQIIDLSSDRKESITYYTLKSTSQDVTINTEKDENN